MNKKIVLSTGACLVLCFLLGGVLTSCYRPKETKSVDSLKVDWVSRYMDVDEDSLLSGTTYLSMYSQIYSQSQEKIYGLTNIISIRNTSLTDSVFMDRIDLYESNGELARSYIEKSVFLLPMETLEIIINQKDRIGGTGGNFIFDWRTKKNVPEPLFEAVMISTYNGQGLSFVTQGKRIK